MWSFNLHLFPLDAAEKLRSTNFQLPDGEQIAFNLWPWKIDTEVMSVDKSTYARIENVFFLSWTLSSLDHHNLPRIRHLHNLKTSQLNMRMLIENAFESASRFRWSSKFLFASYVQFADDGIWKKNFRLFFLRLQCNKKKCFGLKIKAMKFEGTNCNFSLQIDESIGLSQNARTCKLNSYWIWREKNGRSISMLKCNTFINQEKAQNFKWTKFRTLNYGDRTFG